MGRGDDGVIPDWDEAVPGWGMRCHTGCHIQFYQPWFLGTCHCVCQLYLFWCQCYIYAGCCVIGIADALACIEFIAGASVSGGPAVIKGNEMSWEQVSHHCRGTW